MSGITPEQLTALDPAVRAIVMRELGLSEEPAKPKAAIGGRWKNGDRIAWTETRSYTGVVVTCFASGVIHVNVDGFRNCLTQISDGPDVKECEK